MQDILAVVSREFELVNELIVEQLDSDVAMVENVGHYIVDSGGKRLRPLLALLTGRALGECSEAHIRFAATIEFIHTATLLHDDVVDISSLRRGRPTANAEFGNAPSVLVGDFLYTRAFQLMVQIGDLEVLRHMADVTNTIAEGEVLQLSRAGSADITEAQYIDVITRKTAILFAAACRGAGALAGAPQDMCRKLHEFGLNLGIAFQMVDDVLDYDGDPGAMGKNVGDDLTEGKATLPLIHTMQVGDARDSALVRDAITEKSADNLDAVLTAVKRNESLDYTRQSAQRYHSRAVDILQALPRGRARTALQSLAALSVDRDR